MNIANMIVYVNIATFVTPVIIYCFFKWILSKI
jgi:hypothetical protein